MPANSFNLFIWINILTISTTSWTIPSSLLKWPDYAFAVASYDNSIYIIGGYEHQQQLTEYKPDTDTFYDLGDSAFTLNYYFQGQAWTQQHDIVYMLRPGTRSTPNRIPYFNLNSFPFKTTSIMTESGIGKSGCLASSEDHLYVVGGNNGPSYVTTFQVLQFSTNEWISNVPSMATARGYAACTVTNDNLWVFGGLAGVNVVLDANERIDIVNIAQNTWETTSPLKKAVYYSRAVSVGNLIYIIGGRNSNSPVDTVQMLDITTDTMSYADPLQYAIEYAGTITIDNVIFVFGGKTVDTGTNTWMYQIIPTINPSSSPTGAPTIATTDPSSVPTDAPTLNTEEPTNVPSVSPTTVSPTVNTEEPTNIPSVLPTTKEPTNVPSVLPTTEEPTNAPSVSPTTAPPTNVPTTIPTSPTSAPLPSTTDQSATPTSFIEADTDQTMNQPNENQTDNTENNNNTTNIALFITMIILICILIALCYWQKRQRAKASEFMVENIQMDAVEQPQEGNDPTTQKANEEDKAKDNDHIDNMKEADLLQQVLALSLIEEKERKKRQESVVLAQSLEEERREKEERKKRAVSLMKEKERKKQKQEVELAMAGDSDNELLNTEKVTKGGVEIEDDYKQDIDDTMDTEHNSDDDVLTTGIATMGSPAKRKVTDHEEMEHYAITRDLPEDTDSDDVVLNTGALPDTDSDDDVLKEGNMTMGMVAPSNKDIEEGDDDDEAVLIGLETVK